MMKKLSKNSSTTNTICKSPFKLPTDPHGFRLTVTALFGRAITWRRRLQNFDIRLWRKLFNEIPRAANL